MRMSDQDPVKAEIVLYQSEGANVPVEVSYMQGTFWMPQKRIAELFGKDKSTISRHLKNVFEEGELDRDSVVANIATTAADGKTYRTDFYSLDAILAVVYRVNSPQATRFRQWATATLKEYVTKGFVLNDDMLKNGRPFGEDYFDELLVRVRDIRASERRVWIKVCDIFQQLTSMEQCEQILDGFLAFNGRDVLKGLGNRNKKTADRIARERFAEFQRIQDAEWENDFERMAKGLAKS